jgi:hypothetical protein
MRRGGCRDRQTRLAYHVNLSGDNSQAAPGAFSLRRNKERAVKVGWLTWTFFKDETDEST